MALDFESWYRAEYPRLVNTLAIVTGDRGLSADAAAEACTRALARWDRVSRMSRPGGWIYRVALNEARRRMKRSAKEHHLLVQQAATMSVTTPPVEGDPDLWAAVARLPDRTRAVVVLRYVADLTEPEVARALGVRRGTVATMLRRAHISLGADIGSTSARTTEEYAHAFHR